MIVLGVDVREAHQDHAEDNRHLNDHNDRVDARRFLNADDE